MSYKRAAVAYLVLLAGGCKPFERPPNIGDDDAAPDASTDDNDSGASIDVTIALSAPIPWSFDPLTTSYELETSVLTQQTTVTVSAPQASSITLNDATTLASDVASPPVFLASGVNLLTVDVIAPQGDATYTIMIDRGAIDPAQFAYVKASNTESSDFFGRSIALDGDTLVVGAFGEDSIATGVDGNEASNAAANSGAVYVLRRTGDVWTQEAYLKASNTEAADSFGVSVAISGDLIAVGADGEDSNATLINGSETDNSASGAGAVYVFRRTAGFWIQEAYIKPSNTGAGDRFGFDVSLAGDTLAVGANGEDSAATGINGNASDNSASLAGAAYVFRRSGTTWSQEAYVKAPNTEAGDYFGWAVAVDGDALAVGAFSEDSGTGGQADNSALGAGAAYTYRRNGAIWTYEAYVKAPMPDAGDAFGVSIDVSQDRLVVGAQTEDSNATGVNGDQSNDAAGDSGAAYVFVRSGSIWVLHSYLKASNTGPSDAFGWSVSIEANTLVVGATLEASNATGVNGNSENDQAATSGAAYVFRWTGSAWTQVAYLKASNTESNDQFGHVVATSMDSVAVGALNEASMATGVGGDDGNNGASQAGAVYVFR